jgi:hypothetical protein
VGSTAVVAVPPNGELVATVTSKPTQRSIVQKVNKLSLIIGPQTATFL